MRFLILLLLLLSCGYLLLAPSVSAQPVADSPPTRSEKDSRVTAADAGEEAPPDDPFAETAQDAAPEEGDEQSGQGAGETSWERLKSEREPDPTPTRAEEPPDTFSPMAVWRAIRRLWSDD